MIDPALLTDEFFEELEQYILKPKKEKSFTVLSTKKSKSDCGANAEGGGGFQPGNTCAAGDGEKSGGSKVNPKVLAWAKKHFGDDETAQNFAEWFGDSKAVDEDGNPLLLYHGTDADVDGDFEFQKSRIGSKTDSGFYGSGFYLTPWKSEANYYASKVHAFYAQMENPVVIHGPNDSLLDVGMVEQWERYRPRLEAAGLLTPKYKEALDYLAAKKKHITPLIKTYQMGNGPDADETGWLAGIDDDSLTFDSGLEHGVHLHKPVNFEWMDDGRRKNIYYESAEAAKKALLAKAMFQALEIHGRKGGVSRLPTMSDYFRTELTSSQITEKAKANGFDSVIFGDEHLVFEPEQIKSATLNNGKFDPKDGRVGKSFSVVAIKSSDCGANAEGGGGFQIGNTCASGDSDSENKKHEKFLKWFDSQGWDHPFMRGARAWGLKHEDGTEGTVYVKMFPSVNKDAVHISEIFAHPTGKGFGTAILERITEEADKQGVTLDLSAVPFGEDKMPSQDLIEYYKKHGFRPRGKGFAEDELVRKPKKKSKSFGVAVIKSSDCGANAEGGGGFQPGNTCAAGEGSSKTETREFREWFGDSKVVGEDGRPLVVFHGTNREFNSFSHDAEQQNDAGFAGEGFYFMSSKEWGDGYAEVAVDNSGGEARTIEAYLRIENPKVISDYQEVIKGRDIRESGVARAVAKEIRESGHDGVILMPKKKGGPREYMVLDPVQIKSATNNRGTFDPSDPDITKSFSLKSSDCGANAEGGGGFQIGNTCASKDNKVTESTIGLKGAMNEIEERTGKKFPKDEADQMAHVVSLHEKGKITKTQRDKYFKELERYFEEDMKARGFGAAESMFPAPKNVKVSERATINKGSALKELGLPEDIDVKKLALVAGVGDDAQVSVEYRSKDITFHVTDGYKSQSKLYKDNDGDFVIYNRYMEVKKRGQGLGTEVLQRQVEAASRMGVSKLKGVAVRREGTTGVPLVGYYVWPRLGYDGKLTDLHKKALPKELSEYDPEMVSDLMMSKKGRDWWRANGSTFNVEFDLSKNSWGRKTLERLIRKKREGKE